MKRFLKALLCFLLVFFNLFMIACNDTPEEKEYNISFYNEQGILIKQEKYKEGETPNYTYSISDDETFLYTFEGWSLTSDGDVIEQLSKVTKDESYYAIVSKTKKDVSFTFPANETNKDNLINIAYNELTLKLGRDTSGLNNSDKIYIKLLYDVAFLSINLVSGNSEEIKAELNAIYSRLDKSVDAIILTYGSFEKEKENKLIELKAIYESFLSIYEDGKERITNAYESVKSQIESIKENSDYKKELKDLINEFITQLSEELVSVINSKLLELKQQAILELNEKLDALISKIDDNELKLEVTNFKNAELAKINALNSLDNAKATLAEIVSDTSSFIQTIITKQLKKLKDEAILRISNDLDTLISKIDDNELKLEVTNFKNAELAKINAIDSLDNTKATLAEIVSDTNDFIQAMLSKILKQLKDNAIAELDIFVNNAISKLKSNALKDELRNYYNSKKEQINNINSPEDVIDLLNEIVDDVKDFALKLVASQTAVIRDKAIGYIDTIKASLDQGPYSFIPSSMQQGTIYTLNDLTYDFSSFVNVSNIIYGGYGEQWNMVLTNIEESERFTKAINISNSIFEIAIKEIKEYLASEYSEDVNHSIDKNNFSLTLSLVDNILTLNITYKTNIDNSFFGKVSPSITMIFDTETNEKEVSIVLSNTNSLRYILTDNKYEFGITYGVSKGSRTSYCVFNKLNNGTIEGHVFETITVASKDIKSCADFYITDEYISVVGNKASGMVGFSGYINELYKTNEGKLLGYEVKETLTFAGISGTYNTLWFNLDDISGLVSIKALDHNKGDNNNKNDFYVNGITNKIFTPAYNKKLVVKTSRKFDIEFRKQYFYYLDNDNNVCKKEVEVPMMFIQADNDSDTNFSDYPTDVYSNNNINSTVIINSNVLNKIQSDYASLIDIFIVNKDNTTSETVKAFINNN